MIDIGLADALVGGLRSLLSPCSVSPLPAFFAYAFAGPGRLLGRTGLCYPGLLTTLVPLGVLAAGLGAVLAGHRDLPITVVGTLVILAGGLQLLGIPLPPPVLALPWGRLGARGMACGLGRWRCGWAGSPGATLGCRWFLESRPSAWGAADRRGHRRSDRLVAR